MACGHAAHDVGTWFGVTGRLGSSFKAFHRPAGRPASVRIRQVIARARFPCRSKALPCMHAGAGRIPGSKPFDSFSAGIRDGKRAKRFGSSYTRGSQEALCAWNLKMPCNQGESNRIRPLPDPGGYSYASSSPMNLARTSSDAAPV